jgi:catechol 2,3-dioxygenase-like lactoylglutathione lyase family enzyme
MLTHVMVGTNDLPKAKAFYDAALEALGSSCVMATDSRAYYAGEGPAFVVTTPANGEPAQHANGGTIGFAAKSAADVDAFHAAGLAQGGICEGAPGVRVNSPGQQYGAYLRDPDGNKICAFAPNPGNAA